MVCKLQDVSYFMQRYNGRHRLMLRLVVYRFCMALYHSQRRHYVIHISGLSILLHAVLSIADATSCDKYDTWRC